MCVWLHCYTLFLKLCMYCTVYPSSFHPAFFWEAERKRVALMDVLMHSCAQREPCEDAVFFQLLAGAVPSTDTSRLRSCSPSTSLQLHTQPQLCWKRMGDKLGLSGGPTLLINTVHWQGAPVRSNIKYIWKGVWKMCCAMKKTHFSNSRIFKNPLPAK